jgi:hypothetical protein
LLLVATRIEEAYPFSNIGMDVCLAFLMVHSHNSSKSDIAPSEETSRGEMASLVDVLIEPRILALGTENRNGGLKIVKYVS